MERERVEKERDALRKQLEDDAATARARLEERDGEVQRLTEELTTQRGEAGKLDEEVRRLQQQLTTERAKFETATRERALEAELAQLRAVEAVRAEVRDREARAEATILELRKLLEASKTPSYLGTALASPVCVDGDSDLGERTAGDSDSVASKTSKDTEERAMFVAQQRIPDIGRFS